MVDSNPRAPETATPPALASLVPVVEVLATGQAWRHPRRGEPRDQRSRWLAAIAGLATPTLGAVDELAVRQALRALADATVRARAADLEGFRAFCAAQGRAGLPATPATIVAYADSLAADGQKVTSISRKLSSIGIAHQLFGLDSPCSSMAVHYALRGIRKERGVARKQALAVRLGDTTDAIAPAITLRALLDGCSDDPRELRDAALLSVAYDGGLRASEVIAITVEDIAAKPDGSGTVYLKRSKTDQVAAGAYVYLSAETMIRIARWLEVSTITTGTVFRSVQRRVRELQRGRPARPDIELLGGGKFIVVESPAVATVRQISYLVPRETHPGAARLSPQGLAKIYRTVAQRAADRSCIDLAGVELKAAIKALSTHGFRVGLTQDLFAEQFDVGQIQLAMRWKSPATALGYARELNTSANAAAQFLKRRRA